MIKLLDFGLLKQWKEGWFIGVFTREEERRCDISRFERNRMG
jgi:hypothetical protein